MKIKANQNNPNQKPQEKNVKVLEYLRKQLKMKNDRLKSFEQPLTPEETQNIMKVEELILKNQIWELENYIQVIEMME